MATSDLNEYKILEYVAADTPIDAFGVGTDLATSSIHRALGVVYKMVELDGRYTAKFSEDKHTMPGTKQVFRFADQGCDRLLVGVHRVWSGWRGGCRGPCCSP